MEYPELGARMSQAFDQASSGDSMPAWWPVLHLGIDAPARLIQENVPGVEAGKLLFVLGALTMLKYVETWGFEFPEESNAAPAEGSEAFAADLEDDND